MFSILPSLFSVVELLSGSNLQIFAALGDGTPLSVKGTMEVDRTMGVTGLGL